MQSTTASPEISPTSSIRAAISVDVQGQQVSMQHFQAGKKSLHIAKPSQTSVASDILSPRSLSNQLFGITDASSLPLIEKSRLLVKDESPLWMNKETATHCFKCSEGYGIFKKPHHCKLCGKLFHNNCVPTRTISVSGVPEAHRICESCWEGVVSVEDESPTIEDDLDEYSSVKTRDFLASASNKSENLNGLNEFQSTENGPTKLDVSDVVGVTLIKSPSSSINSPIGNTSEIISPRSSVTVSKKLLAFEVPDTSNLPVIDKNSLLIKEESSLWMSKETATHCFKCNEGYGLFKKPHHCKMCGKLFHKECVPSRTLSVSGLAEVHRICDDCWEAIIERNIKMNNIPTEDEVNQEFEIFMEEKCATEEQMKQMRLWDIRTKWDLLTIQTVSFYFVFLNKFLGK